MKTTSQKQSLAQRIKDRAKEHLDSQLSVGGDAGIRKAPNGGALLKAAREKFPGLIQGFSTQELAVFSGVTPRQVQNCIDQGHIKPVCATGRGRFLVWSEDSLETIQRVARGLSPKPSTNFSAARPPTPAAQPPKSSPPVQTPVPKPSSACDGKGSGGFSKKTGIDPEGGGAGPEAATESQGHGLLASLHPLRESRGLFHRNHAFPNCLRGKVAGFGT